MFEIETDVNHSYINVWTGHVKHSIMIEKPIKEIEMKIQVLFYQKEKGNSPVKKFIESLDEKTRSKTYNYIDSLREYGNNIHEVYPKRSKKLNLKNEESIYELTPKPVRIFYFFTSLQQAILTNGYIKLENKTDPEEIEKAIRLKKSYLKTIELRKYVTNQMWKGTIRVYGRTKFRIKIKTMGSYSRSVNK